LLLVKTAQFTRDQSKQARAKFAVVLSTNGAGREWWFFVMYKGC